MADHFPSETWNELARLFKDFIVNHLRTKEMINSGSFDDIIPRKIERQIADLTHRERKEEAAELFLKALQDSEEECKWSIFREELNKPEHELIKDIFMNGVTEEHDINYKEPERALTIFRKDLADRMNSFTVTESCKSSELLTQFEYQKIQAYERSEGQASANVLLLSYIPHNKDWFKTFMNILWTEDRDLVKLVDEETYQKFLAKEEDEQSMDTEETYPEVVGPPVTSHKVMSNPPSEALSSEHVYDGVATQTFLEKMKANTMCFPDSLVQTQSLKESESKRQKKDTYEQSINMDNDWNNPKRKKITFIDEKSCENYDQEKREENRMNCLNPDANVNEQVKFKKAGDADETYLKKNIPIDDAGCDQKDSSELQVSDSSNVEEQPDPAESRQEEKKLQLRSYQTELAELALQGKNVVICAPTGTGKTCVAISIISEHLDHLRGKIGKVVFLVNQRALADQQFGQCKTYLGMRYKCTLICGDTELKVPLKDMLMRNDVIVMTTQILVDALSKKEIDSVCKFSLVVLDECHHTKDNHPFNMLMYHYFKAKFPNLDSSEERRTSLPQIVGLTASVGVGKAKSEEAAVEHIKILCANLDAEYLCTVDKHKKELHQCTNSPEHSIDLCLDRLHDEFRPIVESIMQNIEGRILQMKEQEGLNFPPFPSSRLALAYLQHSKALYKEFAKIKDNPKIRRDLEIARRHLEIYHKALNINEDSRTIDAFKSLKIEFAYLLENMGPTATPFEMYLAELFEKHKENLRNANQHPRMQNPKLIKLHEMIQKGFANNPDSRAIVFVKTRELASSLVDWIKDTEDIKHVKPCKMVGAKETIDKGGMTQRQQEDVMKYFKDGKHKLIVATSVAQEGLDVTECNLVIQYNFNSNEIAMVQARGRARAEVSSYKVLATATSSIGEREELNLMRELLMNKGMKILQQDIRNNSERYKVFKDEHQFAVLKKRQREAERGFHALREGDFKLVCSQCDSFFCISGDIWRSGSHYIVTDEEIGERISVKKHHKPDKYGGVDKRGKLYCSECNKDLGVVCRMEEHYYPIIKIESFVLEDVNGIRKTFKKWRQVNFAIRELERLEDFPNIDDLCHVLDNM